LPRGARPAEARRRVRPGRLPPDPARRRQAGDDPEPARRLPRADRAARGALREAGAAAAVRGHALAGRGPRPHPRHPGDAPAGGGALSSTAVVIIRKTPEEIEQMAAAGRVLTRCHGLLRAKARPGVTT